MIRTIHLQGILQGGKHLHEALRAFKETYTSEINYIKLSGLYKETHTGEIIYIKLLELYKETQTGKIK